MTSTPGPTVLLADDEQFFRLVLGRMLGDAGFTVVAEAADGDEAVAKFREFSPDLVFMDVYMPNRSGIDATRDIMDMDPRAKILICSGTGYDDDINAALQAGARATLLKPFYEDEVMETVRTVLAA